MFSVTQRIQQIIQPYRGYVPISLFEEYTYIDDYKLYETESFYASIMGLAVDYLSRFLFFNDNITDAFQISLMGAERANDLEKAFDLIMNMHRDMSDMTIMSACRLVCYDAFYRSNGDISVITEIPKEVIENIRIMLKRVEKFSKKYGPICKTCCTFEGGYSSVVTTGDGDFLTKDTFWDFKCSKKNINSSWTLQLMMYYIMGVVSKKSEYKSIKKLGFMNPYLNKVWICNIDNISLKSCYAICDKVLCYKMKKSLEDSKYKNLNENDWYWDWKKEIISVENYEALEEILDEFEQDNGFNPFSKNIKDGITKITLEDYWSYYKRTFFEYNKPSFRYIEEFYLLKKKGFIMFIGKNIKNNVYYILYGKRPKKCSYSIDFYIENLDVYANKVLESLSQYWDYLYKVSKELKSIPENVFSGRIHGCIIDIDFYNHLYVNPFDGKITPYYAETQYSRLPYTNIPSLLKNHYPSALPAFNKYVKELEQSDTNKKLLVISNGNFKLQQYTNLLADLGSDFDKPERYYDRSMYDVSLKFKTLETIYTHKLIMYWYDSICGLPVLPKKSYKEQNIGLKKKQKSGYIAEIIDYVSSKDITVKLDNGKIIEHISKSKWEAGTIGIQNNLSYNKMDINIGDIQEQQNKRLAKIIKKESPTYISIQFDDGTIIEHVLYSSWKKGIIKHPNDMTHRSFFTQMSKSYIGKSKRMNCGLYATVIEDKGYKDITVQFEDGLIRQHMRRDKFDSGNIGHNI